MLRFTTAAFVLLFLFTTNTFASTLQEALKSGKISGQFNYIAVKGSDADTYSLNSVRNRDSSAVTTRLNYKSGDFYHFSLGAGFQASKDLRGLDAADANPDGPNDTRVSITGASLFEFYLAYNIAQSELKVGRQIIHTPLLNNAEQVYPMVDYFDAAVFTTNLLPQTMLKALVIQQWHQRELEYDTHFGDPLYSVFIVNHSIPNLTLLGQYMVTTEDDYNS